MTPIKIIDLKTYHIKPRWLFLKITTDTGIVGFGEPVIEGQSKVVEAAVHSLGKYIMGEDPREIEHLWQKMYRCPFYRGGAILVSAISGIEQALWDIKGKYYKMPVYEMLGGKVRKKIKIYPHLEGAPLKAEYDEDQLVERARIRKEQGFSFIKFVWKGPHDFIETKEEVDKFVNLVKRIRETIGDDMSFGIDFHGRVSPPLAIRLCRLLEPFQPMFIEEPVLPENVDVMVKVKESTSIPIASGERLFTRWGFRELLEKQAVSIVQPDICHAGGIMELKKIAAMAEVYYCGIAPHNPLGPISLAACLQVDACTPNFIMQEHPGMDNGHDRGVGIFKKPFEIKDGYVDVPTGHGLGFEVIEENLESLSYDGEIYSKGFFDKDDGSVRDH